MTTKLSHIVEVNYQTSTNLEYIKSCSEILIASQIRTISKPEPSYLFDFSNVVSKPRGIGMLLLYLEKQKILPSPYRMIACYKLNVCLTGNVNKIYTFLEKSMADIAYNELVEAASLSQVNFESEPESGS